ncbi:hypothetical protein niasHT_036877 [Heterodera trifolii]|uniref:Uncharacterized protein n=1 Tax=Heterodera trifolii TaxID=157864 RepID=A0ABD2IE68_9BILA
MRLEVMIKAFHHHILVEKEAAAAGIYREIDVLVRNHRVVPPNEIANTMSEFCIWFKRYGRSYICSQCT